VAEAVTIRVSNQLGASLPMGARKSMLVGLGLALAAAAATTVPLVLLRSFWASLFTQDQQVMGIVTACLPYLAASLLADSVNTVQSGVIKGAGRQATGGVCGRPSPRPACNIAACAQHTANCVGRGSSGQYGI
jgi:MATE family multidrug resistance protein